jgi:hypothetical protein
MPKEGVVLCLEVMFLSVPRKAEKSLGNLSVDSWSRDCDILNYEAEILTIRPRL